MFDLNSIKEPIFILDLNGKIIEKNKAGDDSLALFFKEGIIKKPLHQLFDLCLKENTSKDIQLWGYSKYLITFQKNNENRVIGQFSLLPQEMTKSTTSKERINLQEIIDNLPLNIYLKNPSGEIIYINPYFQRSDSGLNKSFLGLTAIDYLDKETATKVQAEEKEIWRSGQSRMTEKSMIINGQSKSFLTGKVPAAFPDVGKVLLCYSIDITQQKQTSEILKKEKEHAEASSKAKEQFISVISHEIRTPMNTVVGMTNLLLQSQHYPEQRDYLNALKASSDNLLAIVNDILDLSKIESGKIFFEQTDFSLRNLLEDLRKTFAFKAAEKNVLITLNVSNDIPLYLKGDPFRLNQILLNLISNSVKFTEVGTIDIVADLIESSPKEIQILFTIKDTGIGIPEEKLSLIFESFTQANLDISRKYGGTGLGLTITKKLIELQGGNIGVESKINEGSKFIFNLKFIRSQKTKIRVPPESSINKFQGLDNLRLLVVEDNKMNQLVVLKFLEKQNIQADIAEDGPQALELLKNKEYDLILMDIQMPGMDGYKVSEIIRKEFSEPKSSTPIIALTAMALSEVQEKIKVYGINDYILKPFSPDSLFSKIAENAGNITKDTTPIKTLQPVITNQKHTDLTYLINASDNNASFIKQMIEIFLKQTPDFLSELRTFHDNQDWENFRKVMHKMKPTIKMMGINELNKNVEFIETSVKQQQNLSEVSSHLSIIDTVCQSSFKELQQELERLP
ncbi:signal transduction histidine kinase [Sporocytophaga myxococcoides]|uniref:histidine kinase n=1 Tax=Sporocytophaga myxococcoides TaxID=153721 RepID=A0A098LHL4_9BACT|nr:response regulator [Sporocytophaga myxococcoides]GAL86435.1 signal transduction histidine kinase [Sporocytophaga myxococcoides]